MKYEKKDGVPAFSSNEYNNKSSKYVLLIPIINEGNRIIDELSKAQQNGISSIVDIVICDGGSTDGCTEENRLRRLGVNTLLIKESSGKQGAQFRMGIWWAIERGYEGIVTIDGNNKDSIEDVPKFVEKLENKYDFVQGSRFIKGGHAINTPLVRLLALRLLHAPIISLTAGYHFTDTTSAYRAYSMKYLTDNRVQPLRDVFVKYELLAYLSVRASQLGMKVCEVPVTRSYPKKGKTPTKISFFKGNMDLLESLFRNARGYYNP